MNKRNIFLITASFPYSNGEQFLENEIQYYKNTNLTILPRVAKGQKREILNEINIDNFLAKRTFKKSKYLYLLKSLGKKVFFRELFGEVLFDLKKLKYFFSSISTYQMYYELFDAFFQSSKDIEHSIFYTYWNDEATYALQTLKVKYNYILISRVHGGDLYQERRVDNYMPLKRQFTQDIDRLYTITSSANSYLERTYGFSKKILKLSRLGVEDRGIITFKSDENSLSILSCSFVTEVKQIDKIVYAIKGLALKNRDLKIYWNHIGDGVLFNKIMFLAKEELSSLENVQYAFLGHYKNEKVYEFYKNNKIDIFINVSKLEGVPVSIMEAMSCRIPIIAPDIGGVKDMVIDGYNGCLLSKESDIEEIVCALENISFFKSDIIRENSYKIFLEKYNAKKNYQAFVNNIITI